MPGGLKIQIRINYLPDFRKAANGDMARSSLTIFGMTSIT